MRRPFVSAKMPQKCDESIIPTNGTAAKIPLRLDVKFKSHLATGSTKTTPHVSKNAAVKINPLTTIKMQLKIPNSGEQDNKQILFCFSIFRHDVHVWTCLFD